MMSSVLNSCNNWIKKSFEVLEDYCELILYEGKYGKEDIVVVEWNDGGKFYMMVVCPKSCVVDGVGVVSPEYFRGVVFDGWEWYVIDEPP